MSHVVDVHCHTFNAQDVPVRGFLARVAFRNVELARDIAALVDVLIQGQAPGYTEEKRHLDALLSRNDGRLGPESLGPGAGGWNLEPADLDLTTDLDFARLAASEPALLRRLGTEMPTTSHAPQPPDEYGPEGIGDWAASAKRAIKWVRMFGMLRTDITSYLARAFGRDRVDLCTPMLVDLGMGLYDAEGTTMRQQVELQEKISRLSMTGQLPGTTRTRVHPFIGFDPRREMLARQNHDLETSLDLVHTAVETYGFVGVKLYPPMGWRPLDNQPTRDMTRTEALQVDGILHEFYAWCEEKQVPITAHCNQSNGAHSDYLGFSDPELWRAVLTRYPKLHLNLGHFGGNRDAMIARGWPRAIARLATDVGGHLYADVGNHRLDDQAKAMVYMGALDSLFRAPETAGMRERLMWGSDWFMLAALPEHEKFLTRYRELYDQTFQDPALTKQFLGGAAQDFLFGGDDEPNNQNRMRLLERYDRYAPDNVPDWLTTDG